MSINVALTRVCAALALAAGLLLLSATHARAADEPGGFAPAAAPGGGFGATGQWVLSLGGHNGDYAFVNKHSGGGSTTVQLQPSLDYFIASRVSVGGVVRVAYDSGGGGTTNFDIGVRAGYDLDITGPWTWWPTIGVFANTRHIPHTTNTDAQLGIFAPFLFHIVQHLFVGIGPVFNLGLSGGGNDVGLDAVLGGWF
jgi:hypothetical protein